MPLLIDSGSGAAVIPRHRKVITIGLVNNMPDAAFDATERQFLDLLRDASGDKLVRIKLYMLGEMPRGSELRAALGGRYRDIASVATDGLDGLIVTGTEPRAERLDDEPYWSELSWLVGWAQRHSASAIWSCLAAHAAVLRLDGIERRPLPAKQFGVFEFDVAAGDPLIAGVGPRSATPHSRFNDLPEAALLNCGYRVLSRSQEAGVDMFARSEAGGALFLFFQGHPEYESDTLLREYRRDVGRFLRGERQDYPALPRHYLSEPAIAVLNAYRARAIDERNEALAAEFPFAALASRIDCRWRASARAIYRNWLEWLGDRKAEPLAAALAPAEFHAAQDRPPAAARRTRRISPAG
jgi:homoserine O-succinyltransferase